MTTITRALPPVAMQRADVTKLDPVAVATKIIADHGGTKKPDLSAIQRELDAIGLQDADLGKRVRAEVKLQIPAHSTKLDTATYVVRGVTISPLAKTVAEQFAAPRGSADHKTYASLDKMFGDGNWRTDDVLRINQAIKDATISGLSLEKLVAKHKAADTSWTAAAGDFIASVSLGGYLAEAARPALASLARDAGLGQTEWGAALQRVLDKPGAMMAFHAGAAQGFVEGGKDFVVTIASLAGRAIQHSADTGVMGLVGDAARGIVPDQVKGWLRDNGAADMLNAALPSYERGAAANAAMTKTGANIGQYFATHSPAQIAADVKAKIGGMWDSIKADHAAAVAKGPEAESRWWGRIAGRATFEVASTFIPVAGIVGKVGKGAKAADVVVDGLNAVDKVTDAIKVADRANDAVKVADKASDVVKIVLPRGFASLEAFQAFARDLRVSLAKAGFADAQAALQGSAVTGKSFKTGVAFDVGRVSDFDIALSGEALFNAAKEAKIGLRSAATRTGPLTERDLKVLGLLDLSRELSAQAGRPVNFMIYKSAEDAIQRAPSIVLKP